jgi:hypothetical protein
MVGDRSRKRRHRVFVLTCTRADDARLYVEPFEEPF